MQNAPNAYYIPQNIVQIFQSPKDELISITLPDGRNDEVTVIAGEYVVVSSVNVQTMRNLQEVSEEYSPLPQSNGIYAVKHDAVLLQQPLEGEEAVEFKNKWLRADSKGNPLVPCFLPIGQQAGILGAMEDRGAAREHLTVLRQFRDQIKAPIWDPNIQQDATMFDLMSSMFDENESKAEPEKIDFDPEETLKSIEEFCIKTNTQPLLWIELSGFGLSRIPQIKRLQEMLLGCYTNIPVDKIQMTMYPASPEETPLDAFVEAIKTHGEIRKVDKQPDFSNMAPGYEPYTELMAVDGAEYLLVEDFSGKYIYAWPDIKPTNDLNTIKP